MTNWGELPGNLPDFTAIIDSNVEKLQQMQQMLNDYAQAQIKHSIKLKEIGQKHLCLYGQLVVNGQLMASQGSDVIHKAVTQVFKIITEDSKHHATMGNTTNSEINKSFTNCIKKYIQKQAGISQVYNAEMDELKKKAKHVSRVKQQYISAVKDEIKSKQGYDRRLVKRKSSIGVGMGAPSMKQFQKDRLEKVALSNFSRDDYQKSVHVHNDKQRHVYGDVLQSLCIQQQELLQEQCTFCVTTTDNIIEMFNRSIMPKLTEKVSVENLFEESTTAYYTFYSHSTRTIKIPNDIELEDHNVGRYSESICDDGSGSGSGSSQSGTLSTLSTLSSLSVLSVVNEDSGLDMLDDQLFHPKLPTSGPPTTFIKNVETEIRLKVLYDFNALDENGQEYFEALACNPGDLLILVTEGWFEDADSPVNNGWTMARNKTTGEVGFVPSSYLEPIVPESSDESIYCQNR